MAFICTKCEIHDHDYTVVKTDRGFIVDEYCPQCEAESPFEASDYYSDYNPRVVGYDLDAPETDDDDDDDDDC